MPNPDLKTELQTVQAAQAGGSSPVALQEWLKQQQAAIQRRLPGRVDSERYIALLFSEIHKSPRLLDCFSTRKGQDSIRIAIDSMATLGLEPGPMGHCYLVPFRNTREGYTACTYILGYKGMIQLAYRSPLIQEIEAHTVFEGDDFHWRYGTSKILHHIPMAGGAFRDRKLTHAWALVRTVRGGNTFVVLDREEIDYYRSLSKGHNDPGSPWRNYYEAMARKVPLRRLLPDVPMETAAAAEIARDEERELEDRYVERIEPRDISTVLANEVEESDEAGSTEKLDLEETGEGKGNSRSQA